MEFSLLSILLIKNFIQGIILLTLFLINFLFIRLIVPVLTAKKHHYKCLDEIVFNTLSNFKLAIIVSDASIKNNVATSISYIHSFNSLLKKTIHHAINIMSMEAELFAIRCGINQAIQVPTTSYIIVITNALHVVKRIFNSFIHPYQIQLIAIAKDLWKFFNEQLS